MKANQTWHKIHPQFKLNGTHYNFNELEELGYDFVKEGTPFEASIGTFLLDWVNSEIFVEVPTSGSTGKPKNIRLKKEHMMNSALATGEYFQLHSGNKALLCLPCSGIAGKMMLVRAMELGLALDYVDPSSKPLADTAKVFDFVAMVPLQAQNSLGQLHRIKTLLIGGASTTKGLREKLGSVPTQAFEAYGMTETITHIAVKKIDSSNNNYFETLPNIKISTDNRNCLVITAPNVSDSTVITNDIVELLGEGQFKWLGRYDSVINSGGIKLIPEQIEEKLSPMIHPRFFVAGIPDESLGQKLILIVEGSRISTKKLLEQIKNLDNLHKYEVPKAIYTLESFIQTKTGKIQRKKNLQQLSGVL
ncbi:AMP-binding protein [Flagellimonas pacifica]|uniref:O-succinylbenzoic acid--CoA ligase n=1 Tax=Flagellimonas pacifica TaxID=1247520 RepID=A0A285MVD8_9FLAO|nr:AMP-binding protein [Allomuricauda parva]SNY99756.1 O-succinylbenzoic acid--CoA ligase [Allomuricauda parva]